MTRMNVRDIKIIRSKHKSDVFLFGPDKTGELRCVQVHGFVFTVDILPLSEDVFDDLDELQDNINQGMFDRYGFFWKSCIQGIECIHRQPVMGYSDGRSDKLLRISLEDAAHRSKKLFDYLEEDDTCVIVDKKVRAENQFLLRTGVKLQHGCDIGFEFKSYQTSVSVSSLVATNEGFDLITPAYCVIRSTSTRIALLRNIGGVVERYVVPKEDMKQTNCYVYDIVRKCEFLIMLPDSEHDTRLMGELILSRVGKGRHRDFPGFVFMNLMNVMQKMMVSPPLDGFCLIDVIKHNGIFPVADFDISSLLKEIEAIDIIVQKNTLLLNYVEFSRASHTRIEECINMGQQIRVWNKLCYAFEHQNLYVDSGYFKRHPPYIKLLPQSASSHPPPPDAPSMEGNAGGAVRDPIPGVHHTCTFTLDFASLYPSIISGYKVCFRRVCTDPSMDTDPQYIKTYIPITNKECVVLIVGKVENGVQVDTPVLLPTVITEVVSERTRIKAQLKKARNPFEIAVLNAKQLGCKVFQNSVYGFLGAAEKYAYVSCSILMNVVCALGRWMINVVADVSENKFHGVIVYGDTDSVLIQLPREETSSPDPEICLGAMYQTCYDICNYCTSLFPEPNELEFEAMQNPFFIKKQKKMYGGFKYPPHNGGWREKPSFYMKGFGAIKRDRAPFVREAGKQVLSRILSGRDGTIVEYLQGVLSRVRTMNMHLDDFTISATIKNKDDYKHHRLAHITAQTVWENNMNTPMCIGQRISYVIIAGKSKLYSRGYPVDLVCQNMTPIDYSYYIKNQLLMSIRPLLTYHPDVLADFEKLCQDALNTVYRHSIQTKSITHYFRRPDTKTSS